MSATFMLLMGLLSPQEDAPRLAWNQDPKPPAAVEQDPKPEDSKFITDPDSLSESSTPEPREPLGADTGSFLAIRGGAWNIGEFDSDTASGKRKISRDVLGEIGLDAGFLWDRWSLYLTADYAASKEIDVFAGGLQVGVTTFLTGKTASFPLGLHGSLGVMAGHYDVETEGFGDFDMGVGVRARAGLLTSLYDTVGLSLWIEFRQMEFEYDETVISGDDAIGGATLAVSGSLLIRF